MRRNQRGLLWLGISILAVLTLSTALLVEASPDSEAAGPVTTDWTHHHVIFSRPATAERAARVERDHRYWQQLRRRSPAALRDVTAGVTLAPPLQGRFRASSPGKNQKLKRDWAQDMGNNTTVGAANYPAKFSLKETTANCASDFVVYSTGLLGTGAQASIVAYNNVYSGCTAPVPATYWAYNTGGQIVTSPVFSRTGTQIAFVQSTAGAASLVLLQWAPLTGTAGSPATPMSAANASYPTCTVPCMTTLPLAADDSNSSVFYDYGNDAAYVGDNLGFLHKFTPVFLGVPAEVTTGGWPANVNAGASALTSPVYDSVSTNVFVEDVGGFLYLVTSTGVVTTSGQLDFSFSADGGPGFAQGPIVDSSAGLVYAFAPSDGSTACLSGTVDCTAVYQLTTSFISGDVGFEVVVGNSTAEPAAPNPMYIGAFDSTYENSVDPPTGNLYVCGDTGLNPIVYRVPIAAGVFGQVVALASPTPLVDSPPCSPVTDVSNPNATGGTAERLFFSVQNNGRSTPCGGTGCALSFVDTPWQPKTAYNVGQEVLVLRTANHTLWINVVTVGGTSGAAPPVPTWPAVVGALTVNGTVTFMNQGAANLIPLGSWIAGTHFGLRARILDNKGNVEIVTIPGTTGGTTPNWNTTAGGLTTPDGGVTWINAGVLSNAALAATGGTSGFIIDNTVGSVTQAGASQVYFSTLGNQLCTGGTGGCAVQASQSGLQ